MTRGRSVPWRSIAGSYSLAKSATRVVEKECLAIKLATHAFHVYLLGKPFSIHTDHGSLEWLDRLKDNNPRLTRWSLVLQPYSYTCEVSGWDSKRQCRCALSCLLLPRGPRLRRRRRGKVCEGLYVDIDCKAVRTGY